MANSKTIANVNLRDVTTDWIFEEFWHSSTRPSEQLYYEYSKILMNLAATDGVLAAEERKWILDNLAAKGGNKEMYNYFKTNIPSPADLEETIKVRPEFTRFGSQSSLFEAFLAASADGEFHPKERDVIYQMGRAIWG